MTFFFKLDSLYWWKKLSFDFSIQPLNDIVYKHLQFLGVFNTY